MESDMELIAYVLALPLRARENKLNVLISVNSKLRENVGKEETV